MQNDALQAAGAYKARADTILWIYLADLCSRANMMRMLAGAKGGGERKGLTMKERLRMCQQTERQRITFGKVSSLNLHYHRMSLYIAVCLSAKRIRCFVGSLLGATKHHMYSMCFCLVL